MTRRAKDPNAKRMFQLRLDPNNPNEKALIQFLDGQARWQSTLTFLMQNHINQYGSGDAFVALASGQAPVAQPTQSGAVEPQPKAQPKLSQEINEPKVEQPVQPEPQSAPTAAPKPAPQSSFAQPQPDMNPFDSGNSSTTTSANLKANNDSFRDLM